MAQASWRRCFRLAIQARSWGRAKLSICAGPWGGVSEILTRRRRQTCSELGSVAIEPRHARHEGNQVPHRTS